MTTMRSLFFGAAAAGGLAILAACGDDAAPAAPSSTAPVSTVAPSGAWLRLANLSADLASAEVQLDGTTLRPAIAYPVVSGYRPIQPGTHRLRFVPGGKSPIDPRTVELDVKFTVSAGGARTVVAAGLVDTRTLRVVALEDDLTTSPSGVRIRLVHAMSDFPTPLELWLRPDTPLVRRVEFLVASPYRSAEPGNYPLEVRRADTEGPLLPAIHQGLAGSASYTVFAFGTLRQTDLDARLVLDASLGAPTLYP